MRPWPDWRVSESELEQAKARLRRRHEFDRRDDCECVTVRSPVSGNVCRYSRKAKAKSASGTPLLEIGDPGKLEVVTDLLSTEAVKVGRNSVRSIEGWGGDSALEGVVRRVEPYGFTKVSALGVEEQRVRVIIDITEPADRWRKLRARVSRRTPHRAVGVGRRAPGAAVIAVPPGQRVGRVRGTARARAAATRGYRPHERDRCGGAQGMAAGDQVVVHPSDRVSGRRANRTAMTNPSQARRVRRVVVAVAALLTAVAVVVTVALMDPCAPDDRHGDRRAGGRLRLRPPAATRPYSPVTAYTSNCGRPMAVWKTSNCCATRSPVVSVALAQGGLTSATESPDVRSLGTVFYEPVWIFPAGNGFATAWLPRLRRPRLHRPGPAAGRAR